MRHLSSNIIHVQNHLSIYNTKGLTLTKPKEDVRNVYEVRIIFSTSRCGLQ